MNNSNKNNQSRLEKLQNKLYQNDFKSETGDRSSFDNGGYDDLEGDWTEEEDKQDKQQEQEDGPNHIDISEEHENPKKGMGFFGYILILAALFFVGSVGYAAFVFLGGSASGVPAEDIDINIVGPVSIGAGETLSLDLIIQNNNPVPIEAVDLIIEYPDGTKSAEDLTTELGRVVERVDPIGSGGIAKETLNVALFGEEGDNKEITISVEYQVEGSTAVFKKKKVFSIILNAAPARVAVSGSKEVSSGQEIELEAEVNSNSNSELKNLMVVANYPFGFNFIEADIEPTYSDNVWVFDSVEPNSSKSINIKGTITGQNEEERIFRFSTGLVSEENEEEIGVVFNNFIHELLLKKPFVDLELAINGSTDPVVVVDSGSQVRSELTFTNSTNDSIQDLDIRLNFEGDIFDESSVRARDGFYRSVDNTLIFNKDTDSSFEEIPPRNTSSTNIDFSIADLVDYGDNVRNPELKINARLMADRNSGDDLEEELNETFSKTIRVVSDVFVGAYAIRDMGPFQNIGPIPPEVDQETTYTVQWSISNRYNDLREAEMTAVLPTYVKWNNKVSPSDENVDYDERSRRLTWKIGDVEAGAGQSTDPRSLYFQVTLVPSSTQVGSAPALLRDVFFSSVDSFTQTDIDITAKTPNTELNDSDAVKDHEKVIK